MIRVDGLTKRYDDHLAVDGLSFRLSAGQVCGLVGPNGAGKTTTMRCLAGLIPATAGSLTVAGFDVETQAMDVKRRLVYVPDDPPLFDDLNVAQHLDFIGHLYGIDAIAPKSDQLLRQFQLEDKRNAVANTLSRGMRQKLAIACAYLTEPSVLLLDEPLTGLDPPGIRELLSCLRQRAADGATIIISSHLLAMIDDVCSDVLVMKAGRSVFFGPAAELRQTHSRSGTLEEAFFAATGVSDGSAAGSSFCSV